MGANNKNNKTLVELLVVNNIELDQNDVKLSFQTENMNTPQEIDNTLVKYRENILRYPIRANTIESGFPGRARGTYCRLRLEIETSEKFNIFAIMAKYRKSYN